MLVAMLKTLRPHQWIKNVFVFAPVVFAQEADTVSLLTRSISAVLVFCIAAGAVYTLNDNVDVEKGRDHPVKKNRPIASGRLPVRIAAAYMAFLFAISVAGAVFLGIPFTLIAVAYIIQNLGYSFWLKNIVYVDVTCIASGFLFRVLAGCFAAEVVPSFWLLVCTFLLALFLALGKRRGELKAGLEAPRHRSVLKSYAPRTVTVLMYVVAVLTAAAYTAWTLAPHTQEFFETRWFVATVPFVLFGLVRFTMIVNKRLEGQSPTEAMLRDWPFILNIVLWSALTLALIYFY